MKDKKMIFNNVPVTVILLTLNEEFNLPGALENIMDWAEDIFIVDSCSTDRTIDIALEHGVKIVQRPFTNFGDQWNFALEKLPLRTPWTFKLDPDERLTPELKEEIRELLGRETQHHGYSMNRRLWFMGKPLHVLAPVVRLWRTGKCRFSDVLVNEHPLVEGSVGKLKGIMEHLDSRDLHHWIEKQNTYTTMLAIQKMSGDKLSAASKLFGNTLERRMFFVRYFFFLPGRYWAQMCFEFFVRGAWRDSLLGWRWAKLRVEVRRYRELKIKEIKITHRFPILPKKEQIYDARIQIMELQKLVMHKEVINKGG